MDNYGYGTSHGYNSNYTPRADGDGNSVFKNSSYSSESDFKEDSYKDLKRWVKNFNETLNEYVEQKYLYEKEKELKIENESDRQEMKLQVSDNKGFLEDMRKGFDWYEINFTNVPKWFQQFKKEYSIELKRLKRIKKYLAYRVRSYAGKRMYNETSKDMLQFVRIKIDAINILFNPKYNERTPLEDIYGIDLLEEDDTYLDDINTNKLFYKYD